MALAVFRLVHKFCVGHAGAAVVVQLAPSVLVIVTHFTFEVIVCRETSTVRVPIAVCPGASQPVSSQPAKVEVQEVRPKGVHLLGHWVRATIVGSTAGQPQGIV